MASATAMIWAKSLEPEEVDFDRDAMYPIGTIDDRTWIVYTTPDQTLASILEKAKNGGIKDVRQAIPLSDCHLSWGSLIAMEGGKVSVVPYDGGANQKKGLTDGRGRCLRRAPPRLPRTRSRLVP